MGPAGFAPIDCSLTHVSMKIIKSDYTEKLMKYGNLNSIAVAVEDAAAATGNVSPILHEILHALDRYAASGEPTVIDLRAMPFGPGDEEGLLSFLGTGEVQVTMQALGVTEIRESRFNGVWIVDYRDGEGARAGLQLEVTDIPALLKTPQGDFVDAAAALRAALSATEE